MAFGLSTRATAVAAVVAVTVIGMTVGTVLLFATLRTGLSLTTRESYALLAAYLLFVAWVVAETVGVTSLLRGV